MYHIKQVIGSHQRLSHRHTIFTLLTRRIHSAWIAAKPNVTMKLTWLMATFSMNTEQQNQKSKIIQKQLKTQKTGICSIHSAAVMARLLFMIVMQTHIVDTGHIVIIATDNEWNVRCQFVTQSVQRIWRPAQRLLTFIVEVIRIWQNRMAIREIDYVAAERFAERWKYWISPTRQRRTHTYPMGGGFGMGQIDQIDCSECVEIGNDLLCPHAFYWHLRQIITQFTGHWLGFNNRHELPHRVAFDVRTRLLRWLKCDDELSSIACSCIDQ